MNICVEDWYGLGLVLGISERDLDIIRHDYRDKIQDCRREMFKLWLQTDSDASYKKLVSALRAVGDHWYADRLTRKHGKPMMCSEQIYHCKNKSVVLTTELLP